MKLPEKGEIRKPTKTISGITPVAVMLPPRKCEHGMCVYYPSLNVPQSYTPKSPVVMRASRVNYDAYEQVKARLKAFEVMNHPTEKIELIIMGGTFLEYPEDFQYKFVKGLYDGLNCCRSKNLSGAQKLNEMTKHRCVALCVETRPDVCSKFIPRMRDWGVMRVELGVQIIDDEIYKKVKRGHKVKDVVDATRDLKNAGFKVGYHIMSGLPGSSFKKDLRLFKKLFSDERFKPDQLKLYPCQVIEGAELEKLYWEGKYKPYTKEETEKILVSMLKVVPCYCRVMRVMREIPPEYLVAGTIKIDLRKTLEEELRKKNIKLKEIRYREVGFFKGQLDTELKLKISKYKASGGGEYFLEIVNKDDVLFGLLRLRICRENSIIREIHVYGEQASLLEKEKVEQEKNRFGTKRNVQHTGLGKWLMEEAEKICQHHGRTPKDFCKKSLQGAKIKKLKVISGIGVREYYKKLGYVLEGSYMVKKFKF